MVMTFDELRKIKDRLPHGSMDTIATKVGVDVETVRNYFGGPDRNKKIPTGVHFEQGGPGGYVQLDDMRIYEAAMQLLK